MMHKFPLVLFFLSAAAGVASAAAAGREKVLWPSDETVMCAQPDSSIALLPDGAMGVRTGSDYDWPGVRMDFKCGECDLSAYARIVISVSNLTDEITGVSLSVKGRTVQGMTPGGYVRLEPGGAGEIVADLRNMPWMLDAPLELNGMNGRPGSRDGTTFDVRRVFSFHIFRCKDGSSSGFSVKRVAVSGEGRLPKVLSARTFLPFVDRFGQFMHDDWPGKVHSEADLAAELKREDEWLKRNAAGPIPGADRFGGWADGPKLKATGHFRTAKVGGKWWLVDPEGHLFFSHGIDCVGVLSRTGVTYRENYFSWLPARDDPAYGRFYNRITWPAAHGFYKKPGNYPFDQFDFAKANALRKYGSDWAAVTASRAHDRLRAWGLNTVANWSDVGVCKLGRTPYTAQFTTYGPCIEGSKGWWGKMRDPFAPEFTEHLRRRAADEAKRSGTDPWCIGWFVDNELSWGVDDRELGRSLLRSPAVQPGKIAVRRALERKYGDIAALDAAWGTAYGSWDAFLATTNVVPDEKRCGEDLEMMTRAVVRMYFRSVRDAIKEVAPDKLYLGVRIAWPVRIVYEESARYCDVVSVNTYDRLPVRDLPPTAVDKPLINGEFHFGALDRGLFHTGLVGVRDQKERERCYRAFLNACLDHPRYVGTHWFQWRDQCLTGRDDGENYQIGFLTITDTPYPGMVEAARDIASKMYTRRYGGKPARRDK